MYIKTCGIYSQLYANATNVCKTLFNYCVKKYSNSDYINFKYTDDNDDLYNTYNTYDTYYTNYNNCTCDCLYDDSNYNTLCIVQYENYAYSYISLLTVIFLILCCYTCYICSRIRTTRTTRITTNYPNYQNYPNQADNYIYPTYNQYYLDTQNIHNTSILPNYIETGNDTHVPIYYFENTNATLSNNTLNNTSNNTSNNTIYIYTDEELPQYNSNGKYDGKYDVEELENLPPPPEYSRK
jgi:hypothetical protein